MPVTASMMARIDEPSRQPDTERLESHAREALKHALRDNDPVEEALQLAILARLRFRGGHPDAVPLHEQSLAKAESVGEPDLLCGVLVASARTLGEVGQMSTALEHAMRAHQLAADLGPLHRVCASHAMSWSLLRGDESERALIWAHQLREAADDLDCPTWKRRATTTLGGILKEAQRFEEALALFVVALEHAQTHAPDQVAISQANIGNCLDFLGRYDEALTYLEPALAAFEKQGNLAYQCCVQMQIGRTHLRRGAPMNAVVLLLEALVPIRRLKHDIWEQHCLAYIAQAYACLGEHHAAYEAMRASASIHQELLQRQRATALDAYGAKATDFEEAKLREELERALLEVRAARGSQATTVDPDRRLRGEPWSERVEHMRAMGHSLVEVVDSLLGGEE